MLMMFAHAPQMTGTVEPFMHFQHYNFMQKRFKKPQLELETSRWSPEHERENQASRGLRLNQFAQLVQHIIYWANLEQNDAPD